MADKKYVLSRDEDFEAWKNDMREILPHISLKFFQYKVRTGYTRYEQERQLGEVLSKINNDNYSYSEEDFTEIKGLRRSSMRIALRILTENVINYIDEYC